VTIKILLESARVAKGLSVSRDEEKITSRFVKPTKTVYYTAIKHDASIWKHVTREMKRTRGTGECFLHFLSILKCPECFITENRRLKFLHLLYDIGVIWRKTIKHAYSLFYTLIKHEILLVVLCYTNRDKVRGLMGPLGSYADLAFSILSPITQWS